MEFLNELLDAFISAAMNDSACSVDKLTISGSSGAFTVINVLFGYISVLGIGVTTAFFITEMNRKLMFEGGDATLKTLFVPFGKYAAAILFISNSKTILCACLNWHNALLNTLDSTAIVIDSDLTDKDDMALKTGAEILADTGFWKKVILIIPCLLLWVIGLCVKFVYSFKALQYRIELLYRVSIAPIAFADVYSGMNSTAIKYLKGTIALILYGASFIIVPRIANLLVGTDISSLSKELDSSSGILEVLSTLINFLLAPIAALGVLGAVKQVAKEALA